MKRNLPPFETSLTKTQSYLGWIYMVLHAAVFPLLFPILAEMLPDELTDERATMIYYAIGFVFVLIVMRSYLRDEFDRMLDHPGRCIIAAIMALMAEYCFTYLVMILLTSIGDSSIAEGTTLEELAALSTGPVRAVSIFIAPLVEETLFCGVVFGSLRKRSRVAAYVLSVALFCIFAVWEPVWNAKDPSLLVYAIQYFPMAFALTWLYERSGSVWLSILFRMAEAALSFSLISVL